MKDWKYKIFARHLNDRVTYEIGLTVWSNQEKQLEGLRIEFGVSWDIWIDRFPREHPHAALQRRLNAREIHARAMANSPRRADGSLKLDALKIQPHEREAVNDAIARPAALAPVSPQAEPIVDAP